MEKLASRFELPASREDKTRLQRLAARSLQEQGFTPYHLSISKGDKGFSLIEMMTAVALFAIVMLVLMGAVLALIETNRKAQALQSVMNNLNVALDGMVRSLREGSNYHCGSGLYAGNGTDNCANGDTTISFKASSGNRWVYYFDSVTKRISKSEDGGLNYYPLTATEILITDMKFYVVGTKRGCDTTSPCAPIQPKVVMVVNGTAGDVTSMILTGTAGGKINRQSAFHIQATAVQRVLDI